MRVARLRVSIERAAALHRQAAATADAAQRSLDRHVPDAVPPQQLAEQHELAESLRAAAAALAPGWLGVPLDATPPSTPLPAMKTGTGEINDISFFQRTVRRRLMPQT